MMYNYVKFSTNAKVQI